MLLREWADASWSLLVVRPTTLRDYQGKYRKHIDPVLGGREMADITRRDVQTWLLRLSPTVGKATLPILMTLYREANRYDICDNNPTLGVKKKPHIPKRRDFLTVEDIDALDFGPKHTDLFRFLARHGMRWSEVMSLRPEDIHGGYVFITRSADGPTKSAKSRQVPYLGYFRPDFPRNYTWARKKFMSRTNNLTIHSLRKTYAHMLKSRGIHPQVAQKLLGHSTIVLTMDLYTDVLPSELEEARHLLELPRQRVEE